MGEGGNGRGSEEREGSGGTQRGRKTQLKVDGEALGMKKMGKHEKKSEMDK